MKDNDELRKMMYDFIQAMKKLKERKEDIHKYGKKILSLLPLLKILDGYQLDIYRFGDDMGSRCEPYVCKADAKEPYIPTVYKDGTPVDFEERQRWRKFFGKDEEKDRQKHVPYDESKKVVDMLAYGEYNDIPPALPYFEVPFTEEGILQAWLLDNITFFLPLYWHCLYNESFFILNGGKIDWGAAESVNEEDLIKAKNAVIALQREPLYPSVTIDGDEALLKLTYWNAWSGLVREHIKANKYGYGIRFDEPIREVIVPYHSELRW